MDQAEAKSLVRGFLEQYGATTARDYTYDIRSFARWLACTENEAVGRLMSLSVQEAHALAERYKNSMAAAPELTSRRRLSTLRSISRYAFQTGLVPWLLVTNAGAAHAGPAPKKMSGPSEDVIERIRIGLTKGGTALAQRDLAIFDLFYWRGMRAHEVVELRLSDLDLERHEIRLSTHRRDTKAWFPLPPIAIESLSRWLAVRPVRPSSYVFIRLDRGAKTQATGMTRIAIFLMITRRAKEAGVETTVNARGLFRSAVTRAARVATDRKLPFALVRDFARHGSSATTQGRVDCSRQATLF
jgi:integrase